MRHAKEGGSAFGSVAFLTIHGSRACITAPASPQPDRQSLWPRASQPSSPPAPPASSSELRGQPSLNVAQHGNNRCNSISRHQVQGTTSQVGNFHPTLFGMGHPVQDKCKLWREARVAYFTTEALVPLYTDSALQVLLPRKHGCTCWFLLSPQQTDWLHAPLKERRAGQCYQ